MVFVKIAERRDCERDAACQRDLGTGEKTQRYGYSCRQAGGHGNYAGSGNLQEKRFIPARPDCDRERSGTDRHWIQYGATDHRGTARWLEAYGGFP
jgi:hypothetical protein